MGLSVTMEQKGANIMAFTETAVSVPNPPSRFLLSLLL